MGTDSRGLKGAVGSHSTATSDSSWNGPANEKRLPDEITDAIGRAAYAWKDPDGDSSTKAAWKFIHHEVSADGKPGPANVQACRTGIGVLNGGRGGSTIPEGDAKGVYNHLAKHLRDAGEDVPEFGGKSTRGEQKSAVSVKSVDETEGRVTAVFSTLGVVDHDGDVTRPGAFEKDAPVRVSAYGHASWGGSLPVGKGTIREQGDEVIADLQFFLDTQAGKDTFTVVKELADQQEWSYGFDVERCSFGDHEGRQVRFLEKVKVHEVSPVLLGAGMGTRTLSAKSRFEDECAQVLAAHTALVERAADVLAMRQEKGKGLGERSAELLEQLKGSGDRLAELLAAPAPEIEVDDARAQLALIAARHAIRSIA